MDSVQEEIFEIIAREGRIDPDRITLKATLQDLQVESLSALEILFELEEHFGIALPEQQDPAYDTSSVQGLVNTVRRLLADKNTPSPAAA